MGTPGPAPHITLEETLDVFARTTRPCAPLTATEVADELGCTRRTAFRKLEELSDDGELHSKKTGARSRIWWRPVRGEKPDTGSPRRAELERFGAFVTAVEDHAIFTLDPTGSITNWNEGAERIGGYREDEILGEHVSVLYSDDDVDRGVPERNLRTATAEGHSEDEEWLVREDGSRFWADVVTTAVRDDDGVLQGFTVVIRDLTERRERVEALERERDLLDQTLEASPVAISALSPDGEILKLNDRAAEIVGTDKDESTNGTYEASEWRVYDADGEPIPPAKRTFGRVVETGEAVSGFESQVERPDGSLVWLSVNGIPVFDSEDELSLVVLTYEDTTRFEEQARTLERQRDLTDQIVETSPVGIMVFDSDGELTRFNDRAGEILDVSEAELAAYSPSDRPVYDEDGRPLSVEEHPFARTLATGESVYEEILQIERPDGERRWLSVNAVSIPNEDGEIDRVITTGEDITELKEHERKLRRERNQTEELLKASPIAISVQDADGETVLANQRAQDVLGLSEREIIESPEDADEWAIYDADGEPLSPEETPSARVHATGEPVFEEEIAIERPTGERVWASVNAAPVFGPDGDLDRVISAGEDITELKERERQLERRKSELETELNEILGRVSDAFYALDDEWRFVHVNDRAEALFQRSEEDVIGKSIWEVFPESVGSVGWETFHEAMETQEPVNFDLFLEPLDIWIEINAYPSETGLSVYFQDVTERVQRERVLAESERRYRTLAEHFPNGGIGLYDEDLRFTLIAGQEIERLDTPADEFEGQTLREVYGDEVATALEPAYRAALDGEERSVELEDDGREWLIQTVPVTDDDGEVFTGMAMAQDITERKGHERDLERYRTIVETINDGVYTVDADGRFTMVNERYADMTGYPPEELVGSHVSLVVDEETIESAQVGERELITGERRTAMIEADIETADGGAVPAEATFSILPAEGDERERVGVVRDITERKERERALEESERRYRTLAENFPNGVVALFDEEFRYTAAGGQLLDDAGDWEEAIGTSIWERYPEDLVAEIEPHFRGAIAGETNSFEVDYLDRHLLAHTLPVRNADDEIAAGMLVVQDITERTEYRRKLEESNEQLEQFAYVASHDLQEPLRMISNYLQLLEGRYRDALDDDARDFIDFAVDGAERMRTMINDLLAYSRVDTQGDPFESTDCEAVVDHVRTQLQLQIDENDAEIVVVDLPTVVADTNQLEQVFQNLVSNAIKYRSDEPPRIEIGAEKRGEGWEFRVADNGIGIDPRHADRIFDVFKRLHTAEEYAGTGIGLALCKKIVERHGGRIWVDSELGEGSTFRFTIPPTEADHD